MKIHEVTANIIHRIKETASAGATSAGAIASVANPISARAKIKRDRTGAVSYTHLRANETGRKVV